MKGPDYELDIKNYTFYNFARKNKHPNASRYSGRIGILIKNVLTQFIQVEQVHEYMVWITIKSNLFKKCKRNVKIGCVHTYLLWTNGNKLDTFDILDYEVARYIRTHDVMMVGDFNARTGLNPDTMSCRNNIQCIHN